MNLLEAAPDWLAVTLFIFLLLAAAEDAWRLQISNLTSAAIAVGAFVAVALDGPIVGLWQNVVLFAAMLVAGSDERGRAGSEDAEIMAKVFAENAAAEVFSTDDPDEGDGDGRGLAPAGAAASTPTTATAETTASRTRRVLRKWVRPPVPDRGWASVPGGVTSRDAGPGSA